MSDNYSLYPCPFCGRGIMICGVTEFWGYCWGGCKIETPHFSKLEELVKFWNTRFLPVAPVPPVDGVEAVGGAGSVEEMSEKLNELNDGGESK